jgi:serine/threonine-protein kinase
VSEDLVGKTIGKYELHERIGRGGMAEVYKAYHASLDRYVAVKILHPFLSEDPEFKERFEREARNVAQLRHPNIVQVYDFDVEPQRMLYYMVMEYINGPTLRNRLMQLRFEGENFTTSEAIRITRDLASALAYAHSRGMVHRDIKPANIMIDSDGRVVLTDFGIARIVSGPNMTASGSMVGTPAYMSPEQGLGQPGDHRSDIYSLGVVLYQLVTGTIPYDADTPIAIILKHVNDPLPPPSSINPEIPEGLERILYKALAKSPEERYQNIEEMALHLDNLDAASTLIIPASVPTPQVEEVAEPELESYAPPLQTRAPLHGCAGWLLASTVALMAAVAGFYLSFAGLLNRYLPFIPDVAIETPSGLNPAGEITTQVPGLLITETPTPNLEATQISLTVGALATLVATLPASTPTPDLTATVAACDYDYEVVSQMPENRAPYPELTSLTMRITIVNDSRCPLDDDTRLVFSSGYPLEGPEYVEFNKELQPGEQFEIVIPLRTPAYNQRTPLISSTWLVILPDGTQVGPPLTFELSIFQSSPP